VRAACAVERDDLQLLARRAHSRLVVPRAFERNTLRVAQPGSILSITIFRTSALHVAATVTSIRTVVP
jgi:hypothetical protein